MDVDRWRRVAEEAKRLQDADSHEVLRTLQSLPRAEAREVERLLAESSESGATNDPPLFRLRAGTGSEPEEWVGRSIGPYTIESVLGSGGMGTVFRALHKTPSFSRTVALKLQRTALDAEALARFDRERHFLARLEHPNITRLYDGGATSEGIPYLVMELIEGEPLDVYCKRLRLSVRQRLCLLLQIVEATSWVQGHGIVHGDLKPANLLVDQDGRPRLLDFGIAESLRTGAANLPAADTARSRRPMTLAWASPEQVRSEPLTTATDVYALGAILFSLLTGNPPFAAERDDRETLAQRILGGGLQPPSRYWSASGDDQEARSLSARSARALSRRMRGDLDAIVLRALALDPLDRYPSVAELRDDLKAYLEGRPLARNAKAMTSRALYALQRNRPLAATMGSLLVVSILAVVASRHFRENAEREQSLAQTGRIETDETTDLLAGVLQVTTTDHQSAEVVDRLLDQTQLRLDSMAPEDPSRGALLHTLGRLQRDLGAFDRARDYLVQAIAARELLHGVESLETAESVEELATLEQDRGQLQSAETLFRRVLRARERLLHAEHPDTAEAKNNLALVLWEQGRFAEAEVLMRESLTVARSTLGDNHPGTLAAIANLGLVLQAQREYGPAEQLHREAFRGVQRVFGNDHPRWAVAANNLAMLLRQTERLDEAEELHSRVLSARRKRFGNDHLLTAAALHNLALLEVERERLDEAEELLLEARAVRAKQLRSDHPLLARSDAQLRRVRALQRVRDAQYPKAGTIER